jgi:hypothetical protein
VIYSRAGGIFPEDFNARRATFAVKSATLAITPVYEIGR